MYSPELHPAVPPRTSTELTVRGDSGRRLISAAEFQQLADVPAAAEWLANVDNPNTRRAYGRDVGEFMSLLGIRRFSELSGVRRAHVIAWRKMLEERGLGPATRRRKLSAVSSLFRYLCNENAVHENPVSGVRRPRMENANEGRTPALSDAQARRLLSSPEEESLLARRDRALLAVLLYHGLRRDEVARLTVGSLHEHRGVPHFRVTGKGSKTRSTRPRSRPSATTSSSPGTATTGTHPSSSRPGPAGPAGRSPATASTSSSGSTPRPPPSPWSASSTRSGPRPPPTPSSTRPTSPASRTGSATPTSAPPASTTGATAGPRTAPRSASATDKLPPGFSGRDKAWKWMDVASQGNTVAETHDNPAEAPHRAALSSTSSAHWFRLLPDSSAASAALRCTSGRTRNIIRPE